METCAACSPDLHVPGGARSLGMEPLAHSSGAAEQERGSGRNCDSQGGTGGGLPFE